MIAIVAAQKIREKARSQRGEDTDPQHAVFDPAGRTDILDRQVEFAEYPAGMRQESLAGIRQCHAALVANEKRRADFVLEIADAPADRGFPHAQFPRCRAEAAVFYRRDDIAEMAEFYNNIFSSGACPVPM